MLRHQLAQERDAIHLGHLDVKRYNIRNFLTDLSCGHEGISSRPDNFDFLILRQDSGERLPNTCGVIYDQNSDLFFHASHSLENGICNLFDR